MEGTHGQLGAWFTNRLRGDDADRVANLDHAPRAHVPAVTVLANAMARFAGEWRAQIELRHLTRRGNGVAHLLVDDDVAVGDDFAGRLVDDVSGQHATRQL